MMGHLFLAGTWSLFESMLLLRNSSVLTDLTTHSRKIDWFRIQVGLTNDTIKAESLANVI